MNYPINEILLLLLVSIVISAILSWATIRLAPHINLMDVPGSALHKIHQKPTPFTGGIVLITSLTIISMVFLPEHIKSIQGILIGAWIIFIFALLDDIYDLSPVVKLIGQIIAAVVLINLGIKINIFHSPEFIFHSNNLLDTWANNSLTILWVLVLTNAFNFIDSTDGLAIGLGSLSIAFYLIATLGIMQVDLAYFCTILLGIAISLYFFNSNPAHLFLGDSGSQTLGFILAGVAITYTPVAVNQMSSWFVPILIFGVPLFDISLVILSRIRRCKRIHSAANDHVYHRLIKYGFLKNKAVSILHISSLILSIIGFLCLNLDHYLANFIFMMFLIVGIYFLFILDYRYVDIK